MWVIQTMNYSTEAIIIYNASAFWLVHSQSQSNGVSIQVGSSSVALSLPEE